jgi:hypothetical protein
MLARISCKSEVCTVEMVLLADHWNFIQSTMVSVEQEKTQRIGIASCPLQSRITRMIQTSNLKGDRHALDAYRWGAHLIAAATGEARVYCSVESPGLATSRDEPPPPFEFPEVYSPYKIDPPATRLTNVYGRTIASDVVSTKSSLPTGGYRVFECLEEALEQDIGAQETAHLTTVPNRISKAEPRALRDGVVVRAFTTDELLNNIERGILPASADPLADFEEHRRDCVWTGPRIADVTPALDPNSHQNEVLCLSRHLSARTKITPEKDALNREHKAYEIMKAAILKRFQEAMYFPEANLPKKWTDGLRDLAAERMSEDGTLRLRGFVKPKEIGLPEDKLPRGIGNPGPEAAARWASRVSVFEQLFCFLFPNFMMKGLTQEEQDAKVASLIQWDPTMEWFSVDFSAMDSSWNTQEKQWIVALVRDLSQMFVSARDAYVNLMDPSDFKKVHWFFKTLAVTVPQEHCILYSGERGTSIFNRLLVLMLRTAEIIRKLGTSAAVDFWEARWHTDTQPALNFDIGDGDDTAFNNIVQTLHGRKRMYKDAQEALDAYKKYGKTIEPIVAVGRIEILSRFTMVTPGKNPKTVHLVKMPKNLQRLVMSTVETFRLCEEDSPFTISSRMHAQFATTALTRAICAKYTMGFRWIALAIGRYHVEQASVDEVMRFSDSWEADQWEQMSLTDFFFKAQQELAEAEVSSYSMVEWTHFGSPLPNAREMKELKSEWRAFDDSARQLVIDEMDFDLPELLFERLDLSRRIACCVGISPKLLTCCGVGILAKRVPEAEPGKRELAVTTETSDALDDVGVTAKATTSSSSETRGSIKGHSKGDFSDQQDGPSSDGPTTSKLASGGKTVGVATADVKSSTATKDGESKPRTDLQCHHCGGPHKIANCPQAPKTKGKGKGKGASGGGKGKGKGKQRQRPSC